MSFEKVIKEAADTSDEVAELCSGLTKFNSAHPDGNTVQCVDYIKKYLDKHGIENEVHARDKNKPNIVAKIKGSEDRTILWAGHLDVVPEGGHDAWRFGPFSGEIAEGVRLGTRN
jgi:succinyl-diaminopimelate desuccinylase